MRLYQLSKLPSNTLISVTLESGKHICCSAQHMLENYTNHNSRSRLNRDNHIVSVMFCYNAALINGCWIKTTEPLEESDWDIGMYIKPDDFRMILNYIVNNKHNYDEIDAYAVHEFNRTKPSKTDRNELYKALKLCPDFKLDKNDFDMLGNPYTSAYANDFIKMLGRIPAATEITAKLLYAAELTI